MTNDDVNGRRFALISAAMALVTAALLGCSRLISGIGLLTLPVSWPGLLILGADETQERYGYWGELVLFWLCSLPCIVAYARLASRRLPESRTSHSADR